MCTVDSDRHKAPRRNEAYDSAALRLLANGYAPVPLSGKQPLIKDWQRLFASNS